MAIPTRGPRPFAGMMNPLTNHLRGPVPLKAYERKRAKALRQAGWDFPDIAIEIGRSEKDVRHSLATIRTSPSKPARGTINVTLDLYAYLKGLQLPGEAMWETMNRQFGV
jgi:hypothetical protein